MTVSVFKSLFLWLLAYMCILDLYDFLNSKVKRGEAVSSRQNSKVNTGKDWSSFQHRYAERGEPPLKGSYPSLSSTRGKHYIALGMKAKWWEPHPSFCQGFQGRDLC